MFTILDKEIFKSRLVAFYTEKADKNRKSHILTGLTWAYLSPISPSNLMSLNSFSRILESKAWPYRSWRVWLARGSDKKRQIQPLTLMQLSASMRNAMVPIKPLQFASLMMRNSRNALCVTCLCPAIPMTLIATTRRLHMRVYDLYLRPIEGFLLCWLCPKIINAHSLLSLRPTSASLCFEIT